MFKLNGEEIGENEARDHVQRAGYAGANKVIINMMAVDGTKCLVDEGVLKWVDDPVLDEGDGTTHYDHSTTVVQPSTLARISAERQRQAVQWGGPAHDDQHDMLDWLRLMEKQIALAYVSTNEGFSERMMKVAALAVAAVESQERKQP